MLLEQMCVFCTDMWLKTVKLWQKFSLIVTEKDGYLNDLNGLFHIMSILIFMSNHSVSWIAKLTASVCATFSDTMTI
jgi:hypothetical protein